MAPLGLASIALIAFSLVQNAATQKVMPMKFSSRPKFQPLQKRATPFSADIQNYIPGAEYYVTVEVGTPAQTLELIVDTGSSDVWMFAPGVCRGSEQNGPCIGGSYDSGNSKTYQLLYANAFEIKYADGSGVSGDYIRDNFAIGGQDVKGLIMAVATQDSSNTAGIMGIGLDTRESYVSNGNQPYPNLPDTMLQNGLISTKAYSLYLDDASSASGSLLFGGYDTAKFSGDLIMLPLLTDSATDIVDAFSVAWTSLTVTDSSGTFAIQADTFPTAVTLDSGSTLATLPTNIYKTLAKAFGATGGQGEALVKCDQPSGSVDFGFGGPGGPVISVPFSEIATPAYDPNTGEWSTDSNGNHVCVFGFQDAASVEGGDILFGQSILRSAYILYDLENLQLGIAQTIFNSNSSNIVEYNGKSSSNRISTDTAEPQPANTATGVFSEGGGYGGNYFTSATIATGAPAASFPAGASTAAPGVVVYATTAPVAAPTLGAETFAEQAASLTAGSGGGSSSTKQNTAASISRSTLNLLMLVSVMVMLVLMSGMILL